jgi:hypothetical protein
VTDTVVEALILDLLDWVAERPRTHEEVMNVWRTSCPRLPVWEDANDRGFLSVDQGIVRITEAGSDLLRQHGRLK